MSKLLAKIKGETTHKPTSESSNNRSEERQVHDKKESELEAPQGTQPPLMSYESTNKSGACSVRGGKNPDEPVEEQRFSIQPHPATNDPRDLNPNEDKDFMSPGGGACSARQPLAFNTPGPVIPNAAQQREIPLPASRDELKVRSAELNPSAKEEGGL